MQIFIPSVRGLLPSEEITQCLTAFVEWYFYASSPIQTEKTLAEQDALLSRFDELKEPFVNISPSSLNFPKFHSLQHFSEATRRFGTPDNVDTEITEHQHRIDVKSPYRRTNKRNPLSQVVKFVERRTALEDKRESVFGNKPIDTSRTLITETSRWFSGAIFKEAIPIDEASTLFEVRELELAIQTYFHDLEFPGTGYRHRVSRKNLPRLSDPMVNIYFFLVHEQKNVRHTYNI